MNTRLGRISPLFNSLRHMFIVQAIEYIKSHIKQLKESESSVAVGIADLRDKVYQVNEILAQKPQVSAVERLLTEIVDIVQRARNLMEVVQVEQDLAVGGRGVDGVALSRKKMIAKVKEVLESLRELLDNEEDKLRLLLLFLLSYGQVASDDFEDLLDPQTYKTPHNRSSKASNSLALILLKHLPSHPINQRK
ncbi:hypothetical protein BCR33DRAFT_563111 [Rhizoclosmatium globosum]|uniref:Uncharacterized protein n=1 Tax=Rhizoclosmatium globosum TaxID=329046 RepID=A0A1Y2B7X5_9FUNG|nr:hypothetical protein BCR33DRAFT_563111 [Rhizoclosmatium globosum]|eukprot:ORY30939.1 hypothetical protein BCR33DRAFT_563111 [Rhizoclosmatium globosum]